MEEKCRESVEEMWRLCGENPHFIAKAGVWREE
jgi:hypothetical protein